jgi:hypothetical protein
MTIFPDGPRPRTAKPATPSAPERPPRPAPARAADTRPRTATPPALGSPGQASVELVALLPLALLIALGIGQLLAVGAARELAGNGAEAGAAALLQGTDPEAAARHALPGWSHDRAAIRVAGRRVEVRLKPRTIVPVLADHLEAAVAADAGPPS